ncbi:MAG: hypothetical protein R6W95_11165 [Desulfosarcina sp.]
MPLLDLIKKISVLFLLASGNGKTVKADSIGKGKAAQGGVIFHPSSIGSDDMRQKQLQIGRVMQRKGLRIG